MSTVLIKEGRAVLPQERISSIQKLTNKICQQTLVTYKQATSLMVGPSESQTGPTIPPGQTTLGSSLPTQESRTETLLTLLSPWKDKAFLA